MMSLYFTLALLLSILGQATAQIIGTLPNLPARLGYIRTSVEQTVDRVSEAFNTSEAHLITIRDTTIAALGNLDAGGSANFSQTWLRAVFKVQDPKTGNLPWDFSGSIVDPNSIEFGVQSWPPIVINYAPQMAGFMNEFLPHIRLAVKSLQAHNVSVAYSNVYLSNSVSQLLFGEILQDNNLTSSAITRLQTWVNYTQVNGLGEFNSPTYYGEDLNALALGYACSKIPAARSLLQWALNYFWVDISANWFGAQQALSGPHSRNYDFMHGTGEIYSWLYAEGWISDLGRAVEVKPLMIEALKDSATAYHPDDSIRQLAQLPSKLVRSRRSAPTAEDVTFVRMNYVTMEYTAGSIDLNCGQQDQLMVWHISSNQSHPFVSILPDTINSPYGEDKTPDSAGHVKPFHLLLNPSVVQSGPAMLILLDLDPGQPGNQPGPPFKSLATNIIFPAGADFVLLNGNPITKQLSQTPTVIHILINDTIVFRDENSCVGFRIFYVTPLVGTYAPSLVIQSDPVGLSLGAARVTVYHTPANASKPSQPTSQHIRVGILSLVGHCTTGDATLAFSQELSLAPISSVLDNSTWSVNTEILSSQLAVGKSAIDRSTQFRRVNGTDVVMPSDGNIVVNDMVIDVGQPLGPQINQILGVMAPVASTTVAAPSASASASTSTSTNVTSGAERVGGRTGWLQSVVWAVAVAVMVGMGARV